ncbi:MAG: hypothetical protein JW908_08090 [Anaerolineales bacterium]|nr:hypothetical protein [Anaerolineales bacterium]
MNRFLKVKFIFVFMSGIMGVIISLLCLMNFSPTRAATTFTVNLATDVSDAAPGNGHCDSDMVTVGDQCTFRAAIQESNALAGIDTINFRIGQSSGVPRTIYIQSKLPAITEDVEIDGDNQTGGGAVALNGNSAGVNVEGLIFEAGDSVLHNLMVYHFDSAGVVISGTATISMTASMVYGGGNAGIKIYTSNNHIGGSSPGDRNYIYDNDHGGIYAAGVSGELHGIIIKNNYIGLDKNGNTALPNGDEGIYFSNVADSTIGEAGIGNVIAGNNNYNNNGIEFYQSDRNFISGNLIGTDASGSTASGFSNGILLNASSQNFIGGYFADDRNIIAGNAWNGILIECTDTIIPDGNYIMGNYLGTDISGTSAIPNGRGIYIAKGNDTHIGGSNAGAGNLISGNSNYGIVLDSADTMETIIVGNAIGVDANGDPLGNILHGIYAFQSGDATIGGVNLGEGNIIANNGNFEGIKAGICIYRGTEIEMRGNSIYNNGLFTSTNSLGIDLGGESNCDGVTVNDLGDSDTGSNGLINYPVITEATLNNDMVTITGTLNSTPVKGYWIDFYGNDVCDASGHGEGKTYLGYTSAVTDGDGNDSFSITLPYAKYYSAVTVHVFGDTSEFSACFEAPDRQVFLPLLLR